MAALKITMQEWEILKKKIRRKYNHLSDEDLAFEIGKEDDLVNRLAQRLKRNRDYVLFTLAKEKADLESNRV